MLKIFLDMDGVLVDFHTAALEQHGLDWRWNHDNWPEEWNICKVLGFKDEENFWRPLDNYFWENRVRLYDHASRLLQVLEPYEVCLLTAPARATASGKQEFIRRELPDFYHNKRYLMGPGKEVCAARNHLLIDDSPKQCEKFKEAGGMFAMFPRPWNSKRGLDVWQWIEYLAHDLDILERAFE